VGTPRYASINAHKGLSQTPADDIESLLYNLIFLCTKDLPWINTRTVGSNKLDVIMNMKLKRPRAELCKDLPKCFLQTFQHLQNLKPGELPHYEYLIELFRGYCAPVKVEAKTEPHPLVELAPVGTAVRNPKASMFRRPSIERSNFLMVPTPDNTVNISQGTIDFQESQRVMHSQSSVGPSDPT